MTRPPAGRRCCKGKGAAVATASSRRATSALLRWRQHIVLLLLVLVTVGLGRIRLPVVAAAAAACGGSSLLRHGSRLSFLCRTTTRLLRSAVVVVVAVLKSAVCLKSAGLQVSRAEAAAGSLRRDDVSQREARCHEGNFVVPPNTPKPHRPTAQHLPTTLENTPSHRSLSRRILSIDRPSDMTWEQNAVQDPTKPSQNSEKRR